MVDLFKGLFFKNEDDNIPEIHLNKQEPKYSYDPVKKRWIIEGEPEEEEKPKLPPPKINNSIKSEFKKGNTKNKTKTTQRYANVLSEKILDRPEENKNEDKKEENKIKETTPITIFKPEKKQMPFSNIKPENNINNEENLNDNNNNMDNKENNNNEENEKNINNNNLENENENLKEEKNDMKDLLSELSHREEPSFFPNDITQIQEKNVELELEKIKNEYNEKIFKLEKEYQNEINELKESVQFSEENYEQSTKLLNDKIENFINENLELKSNLDKVNDELDYKKKEVEEYKKLFEHYKSLLDENQNEKEEKNVNETEKNDENVLLNSRVEKLESEKMILNNDYIELKSENEANKL